MPKLITKTNWEVTEALNLLSLIEKTISALGWHVALAGSVCYNGKSEKDLDIILYPHSLDSFPFNLNIELNHLGITKITPLNNDSRYPEGRNVMKGKYKGKTIDFIIFKYA